MILSQANSLHWSVKSRGIGNIFLRKEGITLHFEIK